MYVLKILVFLFCFVSETLKLVVPERKLRGFKSKLTEMISGCSFSVFLKGKSCYPIHP